MQIGVAALQQHFPLACSGCLFSPTCSHPPPPSLQTPVGDLLVSFTKDQDVMDDALPDALYYAGIYGLILLATTITVSVTIPLFSALAGALFVVSGIMLAIYLPAATHLKKLRMGTSGAGRWCKGGGGSPLLPAILFPCHHLKSPASQPCSLLQATW